MINEVRLKFWGVRGSIPAPGPETVRYGGNTSCVEIRADGQLIIIDAGSGIRPLGMALDREWGDRPLETTLLISHTHWDHIQGFPFFSPAYRSENRIRVLGYEGARQGLEETLAGQMDSAYFPVRLNQMNGRVTIEEMRDLNFEIGPVKVQAAYLNHPGICLGFRLQTSAGAITYMSDNEPFVRLRTQPGHQGETGGSGTLDYARRQEQRQIDFIHQSDVLIIDAQYEAAEYVRHVGWGHSCMDDSVLMGLQAGVRQLFLFHHDPEHNDEQIDRMVARGRELVAERGGKMAVESAREGLEISLKSVPDQNQAPA